VIKPRFWEIKFRTWFYLRSLWNEISHLRSKIAGFITTVPVDPSKLISKSRLERYDVPIFQFRTIYKTMKSINHDEIIMKGQSIKVCTNMRSPKISNFLFPSVLYFLLTIYFRNIQLSFTLLFHSDGAPNTLYFLGCSTIKIFKKNNWITNDIKVEINNVATNATEIICFINIYSFHNNIEFETAYSVRAKTLFFPKLKSTAKYCINLISLIDLLSKR
jgi:hypothetical protein